MRTALALFVEHGYDGTSVADIAAAMSVSKAAISYHFPAKDDLLVELAEPVLGTLEALVAEQDGSLVSERELRTFLSRYVAVLVGRAAVATWLDADRGVLTHDQLGPRIERLHAETRRVLAGGGGVAAELAATSALGALWRPLRNLDLAMEGEQDRLVDAALAVLTSAAA